MSREGQAPPPDHEDKPLARDSKSDVGERLTGTHDSKDPDGLITLDHEELNLRAD